MAVDARPSALQAIVNIVADYEVAEITPTHVDRWVRQFASDKAIQDTILDEMAHVLSYSYISRNVVVTFLNSLLDELPHHFASDPRKFWSSVNFLRLGRTSRSQDAMLHTLESLLRERLDLELSQCGSKNGLYIYIDDVLCNGLQIIGNLTKCLLSDHIPRGSTILISLITSHNSGHYWSCPCLVDREQLGELVGKGPPPLVGCGG